MEKEIAGERGGEEGMEAWRLMVSEMRKNICGPQHKAQWAWGEVELELSVRGEMNTDSVYPSGTEPSRPVSEWGDK